MPSRKAGTPAGGTPASRQQSVGDVQGQREGEHLQEVIEKIGSYLALTGMPEMFIDAWKCVQKAGEMQVEALWSTGSDKKRGATAQEIADIIDKRLKQGLQRLESKVEDKLDTI
jgi:hypothetical protein